MIILVTGGAGFIGSHLVDRLLKDGNKVIVVDDFSEGKMENLPTNNLDLLVYKKSILDDIAPLFKGVEVVFHLAALPRPQWSIENPIPSNNVNVNGTLNVLLAARDNKVKRVVFASSASIYGEQPFYPCKEKARPNPMSPYALHKVIGEEYCKLFTKIYGLETNCLRFFNVYGTRMNPNGSYASLMPGFIKLLKNNERPTIFGTGKQARDFVYVDDVVEALVLASKCKTYGQVFNVGSAVNYSVNHIFELLCKKLNKNIEPIYGPAVIEPTQTLADRSKALRLLKWKPKVTLEKGIDKLI